MDARGMIRRGLDYVRARYGVVEPGTGVCGCGCMHHYDQGGIVDVRVDGGEQMRDAVRSGLQRIANHPGVDTLPD